MKDEEVKKLKNEIAKRVTDIRNNMGMNKNEFAKYISITPQYLGTIESGDNCLSIEKVIQLSQKTNISTDYILLGKATTLDDKTREILADCSEDKIEAAFKIMKQLALFLKDEK